MQFFGQIKVYLINYFFGIDRINQSITHDIFCNAFSVNSILDSVFCKLR